MRIINSHEEAEFIIAYLACQRRWMHRAIVNKLTLTYSIAPLEQHKENKILKVV